LAAEADELYRVPLSGFIPARDELAKKLKAEGRENEADEVKALRKPTVAVWLANQLAQERELDVQRLRKAGETLAKATAGGSSDSFLEAQREQHRALSRLGEAARELARRESASTSAADRALETLRAASLTPEGRELLKGGVFTEELEPPGFEALAEVVTGTPAKKTPARKDDPRQALKQARERVKELRTEERELDAAARAAEREADQAEKRAAELRTHAEEAQADAADAAERRAEAEAEVERLS
jgi:hypothetical protein